MNSKNSKAQNLFAKLKAPFVVFLAILTIGTVYLGFTTNQAKADSENSTNTVYKKILLRGTQACSISTYMNPRFTLDRTMSEGQGESYNYDIVFTDVGTNGQNILIPTQYYPNSNTNPIENGSISCHELFKRLYQLLPDGSFTEDYSTPTSNDILGYKHLGYSKQEPDYQCLKLRAAYNGKSLEENSATTVSSNTICLNVSGNDIIIGEDKNIITYANGQTQEADGTTPTIIFQQSTENPSIIQLLSPTSQLIQLNCFKNSNLTHNNILNNCRQEIIEALACPPQSCPETYIVRLEGDEYDKQYTIDDNGLRFEPTDNTITDSTASNDVPFKRTSGVSLEFFSNGQYNSYYDTKLTDQEKFDLLYYYVKHITGGTEIQDSSTPEELRVEFEPFSIGHDCTNTQSEYNFPTNYYAGGNNIEWCPIYYYNNPLSESNQPDDYVFNVPASTDIGQGQLLRQTTSFAEVVRMLNELRDNENIDLSSTEQSQTLQPIEKDPCDDIGAMSWIVCPVLNGTTSAMSWMYSEIIEPFLSINPSYFSSGGDIENVWEVVISIANAIMIVFLLIIIFSQLTGMGIDNYGIKKTLPKIIVVAILVNLSFIICRALVDLSNILGNTFNSWLSSIEPTLPTIESSGEIISSEPTGWFKVMFNTVLLGAGAIGTTAIITGIRGPGAISTIWLPLLLLIITALLAILFLFLLLGIRQAGIILLVIIAPLAIICYALPNTKKYYDKWLKAFQGLLLLYPICGALIGGGTFISKLLISINEASGNYMMLFIGCALMVVPYFLIPSLLRGSFKAMGNIGATISGYGRRIRGWSTKRVDSGIRNSERFKRRVEQTRQLHQNRRDISRGNRLQRQADRIKARGGTLSERQSLRLLEANKARNAAITKRAEAGAGIAQVDLEHAQRDYENKRLQTEVEMELEPKPLLNRDNLVTRTQNAINEAKADNVVSVLPVDVEIAQRRRQSAVDAQELKQYQDQFAGYSQKQLRQMAGLESNDDGTLTDVSGANGWLNEKGGGLRMQALLKAMESQGMQSNIYEVLDKNDVSNDTGIMSSLATSNDKIIRAYGKKGAGMDYKSFVRGAGSNSLMQYAKEKGSDFLSGLDDKALKEINKQSTAGDVQILSTNSLIEAAAKMNSEDSLKQVNEMLKTRNDINFSGNDFLQFNDSTVDTLESMRASGDPVVEQALVHSVDSIAQSPEMITKLRRDRKEYINNTFMDPRGKNRII